MPAFEFTVGLVLVIMALFDVFESVVVPRRTANPLRLSPHMILMTWPLWRRIGARLRPAWRREDFLATFAPFLLVLLLVAWFATLIVGFGLMLHALQDQLKPPLPDYETAFYAAGTSLLTIGFGDVVATTMLSRFLMIVAGAAGLTIVALVIALTFNLYASFARREVLVLMLDARAGVPPSGVTLLETYGYNQVTDELAATFNQFELWTAEMLDTHLAYPVLPFFRSSHDGQSWISALGAVIDAATLLITAVPDGAVPASDPLHKSRVNAQLFYSIGCHALVDLTQVRFARKHMTTNQDPGIERTEFEQACRQLAAAGYPTSSSDATWESFSKHRAVYATRLNLLARFFASPPTKWIGDRTVLGQLPKAHFGN